MTATPSCRPRVVVMDNDEDVRNLFHELLCDEGYDVTTFGCHEATRDALREAAPDVVLLDCFLGCEPSGWDLLQMLSLDQDLQRVPVVICTTDARIFVEDGEHRPMIEAGILVVPKPFQLQELFDAIETAAAVPQVPPAT